MIGDFSSDDIPDNRTATRQPRPIGVPHHHLTMSWHEMEFIYPIIPAPCASPVPTYERLRPRSLRRRKRVDPMFPKDHPYPFEWVNNCELPHGCRAHFVSEPISSCLLSMYAQTSSGIDSCSLKEWIRDRD